MADTRARGALDVTDFTIAMHLIQHSMNGTLSTIPAALSPALYASALALPAPGAARAQPNMPTTPLRQSTLSYAPVTTLSPQATGQSFSSQSAYARGGGHRGISAPKKKPKRIGTLPGWIPPTRE